MKILIGNLFFFPALGGIENYILNIGKEFVNQGHEVTVITSKSEEKLFENEIIDGINVIRFQIQPILKPATFFDTFNTIKSFENAVKAIVSKDNYDVFISRDIYSLQAFQKNVNPSKIVYIQATALQLYMQHSKVKRGRNLLFQIGWELHSFIWSSYLGQKEKSISKKIGNLAVLSQAKKQEIASFYSFENVEFSIIPPGVNFHKFYPLTPLEKTQLRLSLKIPIDKKVFVYVGRFEREKNPIGILKAAEKIKGDHEHYLFVGHYDDNFKIEIENRKLENKITLVGGISEPSLYYQAADVFLLPSLTEGFGQVILEAMATSLPTIGFKNPKNQFVLANEEIIENDKTGLLVDYEDYEAFSKAIIELSNNDEKRMSMGINAIATVKNNYSWKNTSMKIITLFDK